MDEGSKEPSLLGLKGMSFDLLEDVDLELSEGGSLLTERLLKMPEAQPMMFSEVSVTRPSQMPFLKDASALETECRLEDMKRTASPNSATEVDAV